MTSTGNETTHADSDILLDPMDAGEILLWDLGFSFMWEISSDDVQVYLSEDGLARLTWGDRGAMAWTLTRFQSPMVCSDPALGLPVIWPCVDGELHVTGRHSVGAFRAIVRGFVNGA